LRPVFHDQPNALLVRAMDNIATGIEQSFQRLRIVAS
jgi:hypothetical protein